jgi:geranylgeranyl diphosphate synthase type II
LKALEIAEKDDKNKLTELFTSKPKDASKKVEDVKSLFNKYEISTLTRELMEKYYQKAIVCLNSLELDQEKHKVLVRLADALMKRNS